MTNNANLPISGPYIANGTNRDWSFAGWKIVEDDQLLIIVSDADGTNRQEITSGYSVDPSSLNSYSGTVQYPVSPASPLVSGKHVFVTRRVPYDQPTAIGNQGGFYPETHEEAFDYLSMQIQQLAELMARTPIVPEGETGMTISPGTSGQILVFDQNGDLVPQDSSVSGISGNMFKAVYDPRNILRDAFDQKSWGVFDTEADFLAHPTIPALLTSIVVTDKSSVGGGGGHLKKRIATPSPVKAWQVQHPDGSWWEIIKNQPLDLYAYGASAASNSTAAVAAMAEHLGFIRVPLAGILLSTTGTIIAVPIIVEQGGSITISTGVTVYIEARVYAPQHQIFFGDGTPQFRENGDHGEQSRFQVLAAWWGILGTNSSDVDVSPAWSKMMTSMGNTRECEILLGVGSFYLHSGNLPLNRGAFIKGVGDRETTFWVTFTTGDVFVTAEQAVRMDGIQINSLGGVARTSGAYIRSTHTRCKFTNIYMDSGFEGIVLEGVENHAKGVKGLTWSSAANGSVVKITGDDCTAEDVDFTNSATDKPQSIVLVDASAKNVLRPMVRNVRGDAGSYGVQCKMGSGFTAQSPHITDVNLKSCGANAIHFTGAGNINDMVVSDCVAPVGAAMALDIELTGAGNINNGVISNLSGRGLTDTGLKINATSTGIAKDVTISNCALNAAFNGFYVGGATAHEDIVINGCSTRGGVDGYEIKVNGVCSFGCIAKSQTSNGWNIISGSDNILIHGNYIGSATAVTDGSGAVTKSITIL